MRAGRNRELDSLLVNLNENPEKPDFALAQAYRARQWLRGQPLTALGVEEYSKFGPGIKLYFAMLKYLTLLFLVLSVAALPSLVVNYRGNGLSLYGDSWEQVLLRFSLANQESLELAAESLTLEQRLAKVRDAKFSQAIITANDLLCSCILLAFLVFWRIRSKAYVGELLTSGAPPSYHTLLVDLPPRFTHAGLLEHFSQFGAVQQIEYVRNYGDFLVEVKELLRVVEEHGQELDSARKRRLYDQIERRYIAIKQLYRSINHTGQGNPFPEIKAFVSFEEQGLAQRVHALYKYGVRTISLTLEGQPMRVRKCLAEPLSILWENYHLRDHSERLRSCCFLLAVAALLLLTLFAVFLLSLHAAASTQPDYPSGGQPRNATFLEAQQSNDSAVVGAFCASLTYKTFQWRYYQVCAGYFQRFEAHWIFVGTLAGVVSVVTQVLIKIVFRMAELRRFRTLPEKRRFMILSIFVTYLVSSSLLALLIRAQVRWEGGSFSLVQWAQHSFPQLAARTTLEVYSEMTRKWYMEIGKLLVANFFLTLNVFPWLYVLEEWAMRGVRGWWARRARTQRVMEGRLVDCEFYWEFYYSVQLNCVYFCLLFSVALPLLYLLACLSLFSLLLTNKLIFRHFTRRPQPFDHKLNSFISQAVAVSLLLHQFAAVCTLTVNEIFPANEPELLSPTAIKAIYFCFAFLLAVVLFNLKRVSEVVEKRVLGKREELMMTEEINSSFGGERNDKLRREHRSPPKRRGAYLSSYKMQDNPYYNNISYVLLVLEQVIADHPPPALPARPHPHPARQHSTSLITLSKSANAIEAHSERNLSF